MMDPQAFLIIGLALGVPAAVLTMVVLVGKALRGLAFLFRAAETIQRELVPNHGGSTYDLVRQHATRLDTLEPLVRNAASAAEAAVAEARTAVRAAEEAVQEGKAARAELAEADQRNMISIARTQGAVETLAGRRDRRRKDESQGGHGAQ